MQYLFDEKGTRYLDMFAGIVTVSVGHCHPYVTQKAKEQVSSLINFVITTRWTLSSTQQPSTCTQILLNLEKSLLPIFQQNQDSKVIHMKGTNSLVCYFMNSGSEANDLAVLMAREYTGNYEVVGIYFEF